MNIHLILTRRYAGKEYLMIGDEYSGLEWLDQSSKPSKAELEALWPQVQYEIQVAEIERLRQVAYQLESDPLFFKSQRSEDGITKATWIAKVEEIRERYPMPEVP